MELEIPRPVTVAGWMDIANVPLTSKWWLPQMMKLTRPFSSISLIITAAPTN